VLEANEKDEGIEIAAGISAQVDPYEAKFKIYILDVLLHYRQSHAVVLLVDRAELVVLICS